MWLSLLLLVVVLATACFGLVVLFGPPFVPTLPKQVGTALDLLALERGQTLLELGSGDGRVVLAAAERGLKVVGYELNPVLVVVSLWKTRRYRKQVSIKWGSYWQKWPDAEGIFVFMLPRYMKRLDARIEQRKKPRNIVRLASFAFEIPNKKPLKTQDGVFLYEYR